VRLRCARLGTPGRLALALLLVAAFAVRVIFGWPVPNASRSVDERYSLENAELSLRNHGFRRANAFHPSLSYLPQTLALAAVDACGCVELGTGTRTVLEPFGGWTPGWRPRPEGSSGILSRPNLTPLAYRTCRIVQALLGTLTVLLTFLIGRAVAGPLVGLAGALVVGLAPWQLWASGTCNEDAGFVLAFQVGILATLACASRPNWRRFLLAGAAFGVAGATKFNAFPVVVPLTAWVALQPRRWRVLAPRLALAAALSIAVFAALDPLLLSHPELVERDFGHTLKDYAAKSRVQQSERWQVALAALASPIEPEVFGPVTGALALVGGGALVGLGWRERRRDGERWLLLAGFPLAYAAVYAALTGNASPHNWMPLDPAFAVAAALALGLAAVGISRRGRSRAANAGAAGLVLLGIAPALFAGLSYLYRSVVPPNLYAAESWIESQCRHPARIGIETAADGYYLEGRPDLECATLVPPRRASGFAAAERAELDGWITDRPGVASAPGSRRFAGGIFAARERAVVAVWRPWLAAGRFRVTLEPSQDPERRTLRPPPEALAAGDELTVLVAAQRAYRGGDCVLANGGETLPLLPHRDPTRGRHAWCAESLRAAVAPDAPLELRCSRRGLRTLALDRGADFVAWRPWTPPIAPPRR